ncbi:inosine triphosphate pyrophosphatase [Histoplasma capsulatum]|uniref:Inosine triphosphate pyrophosphatase n=1 Tax=Ajellomyces capsulatus TaxID=5037 RepID=A0A8A1MN32_AJECA|nr:inosine triphosphate pyrophosphatase [Histoplasma capsulatum G186AR]EEH10532.1 inosine triphosphate pyrophosphatase [Histoplasma capsulatum G186AR]QSS66032.1 inosine triphosphate pyrophosphatase [Histoplasma capsulatum]
MKTINFITGNKNKLAEVQAILGDTIEVQNRAIDVPEIQGSIEEIAKEKCRKAAETVQGPALTEDTALEFNALKGLPGPYIKWFLEALGHDGLNKLLDPYEDKSIVAVCTFAFSSGPGWDPIFEYEGNTFAEMDKDEKNLISHRYKALAKLKQWLAETYP